MIQELIQDMVHVTVNHLGSGLAVAGGAVVAASQSIPDMPAPAQLTMIGFGVSLIGLATAGLPHAYNSLKLVYDDRRERRVVERAAFDRDIKVLELTNNLNRALSRLEVLEAVELAATELKRRYDDLENRYEREITQILKPQAARNQSSIRKLAVAIEDVKTHSGDEIPIEAAAFLAADVLKVAEVHAAGVINVAENKAAEVLETARVAADELAATPPVIPKGDDL